MVGKKEGGRSTSQTKKETTHKMKVDASDKKTYMLPSSLHLEESVKHMLLPGEQVMYQSDDIFFTTRRIIKHKEGHWAKFMHFFYNAYEDLDFTDLQSIKAKNIINLRLLLLACITLLLGPIGNFFLALPGNGALGNFFLELHYTLGLSGLFLIAIVLIISAMILRDRVIEFWGHGVVIRTRHFHDDELLKVRELQRVRLKQIGMDN